MDPFSAGMFASIGSAFKFAEIAVRIAEVGSENAVFVRTIYIVRSDLEEVERLLSLESVQKKLTSTPGKLPWIKTAIHNTRYALNEIGKWVERARVEQESTGSIKFDTRVRWVFSDHEKLLNRKTELSTCHQQLSNVLGYLIGLESAPSHAAPQEYEDTTYCDDILARHRRSSRPKAPKALTEQEPNAMKDGAQRDAASTHSVSSRSRPLPPASGYRSLSNVRAANAYERDVALSSPPISSTLSPPDSPPPTYVTAVSVDPFIYDARPSLASPDYPSVSNGRVIAGLVSDYKDALNKETWGCRSNLDDMAIPELAGDAIVYSATNSAGPVNPYELCADSGEAGSYNNTRSSQRYCDSLSELLGDLRFPAKSPSHDPEPPPGYPRLSRAASDQVGMNRTSHLQLRNRTMSETSPIVHRRPLPTYALSDSLLAVHELPSLALHDTSSSVLSAVRSSNMHPLATHNSSDDPYRPNNSQRPSSYTPNQSTWGTQAPVPAPNRHFSAPPPAPSSYTDHAATFSAESTSSWGLDTQPTAPKTPRALKTSRAHEPAMAMRMQSQKRMLDLLGSIGT